MADASTILHKNMADKATHSRFNPNESWLEGRGSWLTYTVIVGVTHLAILSIPFIGTATAWTLTSIIHCIVSGMKISCI